MIAILVILSMSHGDICEGVRDNYSSDLWSLKTLSITLPNREKPNDPPSVLTNPAQQDLRSRKWYFCDSIRSRIPLS